MPQLSIVCISPEIRETIERELRSMKGDEATKRIALNLFEQMPACEGQVPIGISLEDTKGRKGKSSRAPSKYNLFIGSCMKGGARTLKECAVEWKATKTK